MPDANAIAETYLAIWNAREGRHRRELLTEHWAPDARYVDPLMVSAGTEGVATMIEDARRQFPGHSFHLRGTPDGHGRHVRFSWSLACGDAHPVARGTDVACLDEQGRIAEVIGFLDGDVA